MTFLQQHGALMSRKNSSVSNTDYATYRQIMDELLRPIVATDLDGDTLRRLYESKLVYLENLRVKAFRSINATQPLVQSPEQFSTERPSEAHFTRDDYSLILEAISTSRAHLKQIVLLAITENLSRRKSRLQS